ncbi:MAG: lasso peptide biosynthesis B2 protein [Armatimonadetes bacterium]|nr:lasso peptide biosynthesis B2 protein [Armatimonadota bacterium]
MHHPAEPVGRASGLLGALVRDRGLLPRAWRLLGRYQRELGCDMPLSAEAVWEAPEGASGYSGEEQRRRAGELFRLVFWMARLQSPRPLCLPRALTLLRLLEEDGVHACLRIGVNRAAGAPPRFHAWVEVGGAPVGERPEGLAGFQPLRPAAPGGV